MGDRGFAFFMIINKPLQKQPYSSEKIVKELLNIQERVLEIRTTCGLKKFQHNIFPEFIFIGPFQPE